MDQGLLWVGMGALAGFVVGLLVGRVLRSRRHSAPHAPLMGQARPREDAGSAPSAGNGLASGLRRVQDLAVDDEAVQGHIEEVLRSSSRTLTNGLIVAYDLASGDPAVRALVGQVLDANGVTMLAPHAGMAFDPEVHAAIAAQSGREAGHSPSTVASLVRPGWSHGGMVLRPAEVIVWT